MSKAVISVSLSIPKALRESDVNVTWQRFCMYLMCVWIPVCPQGDFTWNSTLGHSVCLKPVPLQSLSELERVRLQEVALRRLVQCHDLGCHITIPKGTNPPNIDIYTFSRLTNCTNSFGLKLRNYPYSSLYLLKNVGQSMFLYPGLFMVYVFHNKCPQLLTWKGFSLFSGFIVLIYFQNMC